MRTQQLVRVLLLFWALWFTVVTLTNLTDLLAGVGLLPAGFWWKSGNLGLISEALQPVGLATLAPVALLGALLWQGLAAILFFRATAAVGRSVPQRDILMAYLVGTGLFLVYIVIDELLLLYLKGLESAHLQIVIAQLATLAVIELFTPRSR
ncbi:MAG: hypothetical protein K6U89_12880 [Chloroflexi bacterium]|nr:hypothetical protein [Chloroflexota bacterium]